MRLESHVRFCRAINQVIDLSTVTLLLLKNLTLLYVKLLEYDLHQDLKLLHIFLVSAIIYKNILLF